MMRYLFYVLLINFLLNNIVFANYKEKTIIVKLKKEFNISQVEYLLNDYIKIEKIENFLNESNLYYLSKKLHNNYLLNKNKIINYNLDRIYRISYSNNIDPLILARKLQNNQYFEYIEPEYKREIVGIPNDSLFEYQYYFNNCKVVEALESLNSTDTLIIGVVDTGIDYLHEDLINQIAVNKGEVGIDDNGKDKRSNGIDDDNNGFIDDWRGWDFGSSDSLGYDNDPYPGGSHGTHVGGIIAATTNNIIGIAGINNNAKLLPVKIGYDNPWVRSLINSYDGLLYAALVGSDIINCSWGGGGYSQAEQDIVNQVIALGSTIVAAAGNNNENAAFYPAAYQGVISVAATDSNDYKAYFTNYHSSVDVSAPGFKILSTIPNNEYREMSGTSMASPVAAAIAGFIKLKHPDYTPLMVAEHLKATSDDIYNINYNYLGMLGRGRVNALRAINDTNLFSINFDEIQINNITHSNELILPGDTIQINISLINTLKPISNVILISSSNYIPKDNFLLKEINLGNFETMEIKNTIEPISFIIPEIEKLDFNLPIDIYVTSDENLKIATRLNLLINPTFRTIAKNNIGVTISSSGNIAYADYPINNRGIGFTWKESNSILFEGGIIVGVDSIRISDMVRSANGMIPSRDFNLISLINVIDPGINSNIDVYTEYSDIIDTNKAGVTVENKYYQFINPDLEDCLFGIYDVINNNPDIVDSLFMGFYLDWDIGMSGANNEIFWDYENELGICYNIKNDTLPVAGVKLLTSQKKNFFAIDNDGSTIDNPGVYDGFAKEEKWRMISSGIARDKSGIKDVSMVISGGPVQLNTNDKERFILVFIAGKTIDEIKEKSKIIKNYYDIINNINENEKFSYIDIIKNIYPNPVKNDILEIELYDTKWLINSISIIDINGREYIPNINMNEYNKINIYTENLKQGTYFLKILSTQGIDIKKFIKLK